MYGSYGSYSSMSASAPIDISSSRTQYRNDHTTSCAFPSWPRRMSLSPASGGGGCDDDYQNRATLYLSDDELFPQDPSAADAADDDAHSIGSASSIASPTSPRRASVMRSDEALLEMQRDQARAQREYMKFLVGEKERQRASRRRQQQALMQQQLLQQQQPRRGSGGASSSSSSGKRGSKSPKGSKLSTMAPIKETGSE